MLPNCLFRSSSAAAFFGGSAIAAAVVAIASPAIAGPNGTYFDGSMTVYSATQECGETVGNSYKSALRPGGLENNDPNETWISFAYGRGAATILLPKNGKSGTFKHGGISSRGYQWWSEDAGQKFSKRVVKPSPIAQSTKDVTVSIKLDKFWGTEGCKITFKGSYVANPQN